jgi:hypothetical protein
MSKGTFYMGIRIFNSLPFEMKALTSNLKQFRDLRMFHSMHYMNILTKKISNYCMVLILHPFGVCSVFYSNLNTFLSFYIVSYIVTSSYFFNVSVFSILLFYNQSYLLSYILSGLILHPVVSM